MKNKIKHFITICKHKAIVFRECKACGITWQGLIHDLSKFGRTEFNSSAKYFVDDFMDYGHVSPIAIEKIYNEYSYAWQHHKGHNPHHWQYWIDFDPEGNIIANKIPFRYAIEMVCDWIGAGQIYGKIRWTESEPFEYFCRTKKERHLHEDTEKLLIDLLLCIREKGLKEFHRMARCKGEYAYLAYDYDNTKMPKEEKEKIKKINAERKNKTNWIFDSQQANQSADD